MTVIKIEPFIVKSLGGIDVIINGVDPTDRHGILSGTYGKNNTPARWDDAGIVSNNNPDLNLSTNNDEVREAIETVKAISKNNQ